MTPINNILPSYRREREISHSAFDRAFTFIELLVVIVIISILLGIGALAFRKTIEGNVLAQARNLVVTYAKVARSYAVANRLETMMVVNPFNGRFEIWRLNPPTDGGPFDPRSVSTPDGYRFVPLLDSSARLPTDGAGRPMAAVHPIDYAEPIDPATPAGPTYRPTTADADERNIDNLSWAAFCFDENGKLVARTRRIATRTYTRRDGTLRDNPPVPAVLRNRLVDETPDLTVSPMVNGATGNEALRDTPITSTLGFVISDTLRLRQTVPDFQTNAASLVGNWLLQTQPGGRYSSFATTVVLNRFTGQELIGGAP